MITNLSNGTRSDNEVENLLKVIQCGGNMNAEYTISGKKKIYFRQWVVWLNFVLVQILLGMAYGYSAIALQQLKPHENNETDNMMFEDGQIFGKPQLIVDSIDSQSWIASSMLLFMTPGCWILVACSNKLGRKSILLMSVFGFTVSWMIIAFAKDAYQIIVGRSLSGVSMGILTGLNYMYLGECAIPKLRSTFYALFAFPFSLGMGLCHVIGTWYHWRTTALFCGGLGTITLFSNYHLPESPVWLIHKRRFKSALESWLFLRGDADLDEFESLFPKADKIAGSYKVNEFGLKKFHTSSFWKPLGIIIVVFTTSQMSGMNAVAFYCTPMLSEITDSENAYVPTLILDTIRLGGSIILSFSIKVFSTRALMIFSGLFCSLFLFLLALSIHLNIWTPWLQFIVLFGYELSLVMGLAPLPWTFCSELFSVNHKEVGVSVVTNYFCLLGFTVVKVNPYFFSFFEPWRTFLIYALFTFTGTSILYFILPNTKDKSLKEIELLFSSNSKS